MKFNKLYAPTLTNFEKLAELVIEKSAGEYIFMIKNETGSYLERNRGRMCRPSDER